MRVFDAQFKEQMVRKLLPPNSLSVTQLSRETGIGRSTLYAWKQMICEQGYVMPHKPTPPHKWDSKAKLAAVIHTAAMNEFERSEYCRECGLYPEQLDAWKAAFEALDTDAVPANKHELALQRKELKALQREIQRKDKALAEAAALLVLTKKAQAIWGIKEES
jgi:transposase-like protein